MCMGYVAGLLVSWELEGVMGLCGSWLALLKCLALADWLQEENKLTKKIEGFVRGRKVR